MEVEIIQMYNKLVSNTNLLYISTRRVIFNLKKAEPLFFEDNETRLVRKVGLFLKAARVHGFLSEYWQRGRGIVYKIESREPLTEDVVMSWGL